MDPADDNPLREALPEDAEFLQRMLSAYLADIAAFSDGVDEDRVLEPTWFTHEDLHPFVIEQGGSPVGMALVIGRAHAEAGGEDVDHQVWDYYVVPEQRGTGIARRAAGQLFDRLPGTWAIAVLESNERAQRFWRAVLAERGLAPNPTPGTEGLPTYRFRT